VKGPVVVIGIGEMGGVFARGFLRNGHPVYPVTRGESPAKMAPQVPEPELVMVAVAETDLHSALADLPPSWRHRTGLLQNELLPRDWEQHDVHNPTVISVWFEKKKGQDAKVIIPSPVYGPKAELVHDALGSIGIPCRVLSNSQQLLHELVLKNVYILTTNISGLVTNGTVGELWDRHRDLARQVAGDVMDIQESLTGRTFDRDALIEGMVEAFEGDLDHKCMGRSAPARLERALEQATQAGLEVPKLREIRRSLD
jgi:ketopantoate reductase